MSQRTESKFSLDDFPTPPWATRALLEHVLPDVRHGSVLEPACGRGYMAKPLSEYFSRVVASDVFDYGFGEVRDFLDKAEFPEVDWVITNPPFKLAEEFIQKGLDLAQTGVAVFVRTVFLESIGRYQRLFRDQPCDIFAQFAERVPLVKGRVDPSASTATGYCWLVWYKKSRGVPMINWIPPCRKTLERPNDYELTRAAGKAHSIQRGFFD